MFLLILISAYMFQTSICISPSSVLYQEVFTYHNETSFKAEFAFQVVNNIFNAFQQWFYTVTFCEFTYFENRILKYTENFGYGYPAMLLNGCRDPNKTKVKPKINRHGQTAYVVTSDDLSIDGSENVIEAFISTGVFKPRSAVIFVINTPVEVDSYFYYTMRSHFQLLSSRRITNSVMVLWSDRLKIYMYNYFSDEVYDITDVKDVSQLLRKQYDNLYKHELRLSVFKKIYISDETGPVLCDSRLAKTVIRTLNATCKPLPPRDGNTVGDLLENGTATGVTADLIDGYTDMELHSRILKNSFYGYIDTTYPLSQDELCFMIKKASSQSTFMTTMQLIQTKTMLLFSFNVIMLIFFTLLVRKVDILAWNIKDNRTNSETVMDLMKCFLRQTLDIKFPGPLFRWVLLLTMMYSLIVNCAIDGIITSAIAYPRYRPDINTLSELFQDTNLTFAVHNRHTKLFNKSLSKACYKAIHKRVVTFNDQMIQQAIEKRQFQYAILLRKSDATYVSRKQSNQVNGRAIFHVVGECPVPCPIVYGLRYGSPYLTKLNNILSHLNQGGILDHWTRSDDVTLFQKQGKPLYNAAGFEKEQKPLKLENLKEVFIMLFIGLLISAIVFVCEIIWGFKIKNRLK